MERPGESSLREKINPALVWLNNHCSSLGTLERLVLRIRHFIRQLFADERISERSHGETIRQIYRDSQPMEFTALAAKRGNSVPGHWEDPTLIHLVRPQAQEGNARFFVSGSVMSWTPTLIGVRCPFLAANPHDTRSPQIRSTTDT